MDRKIQSLVPLQLETSNPSVSSHTFGGVARNIAENLARMGGRVGLYTLVGPDSEGEHLISHCKQAGIDTVTTEVVPSAQTGNYTAVLNRDGSLAVAMADMQIYDLFTVQRVGGKWDTIGQADIVVADTNLPAPTIDYLIQHCRSKNLKLCIVPVSAPKVQRIPNDLNGVSLFILNRDELECLMGLTSQTQTTAAITEACRQLHKRGCHNVVVTQGSKEVLVVSDSGEVLVQPVPKVHVAEVTGAGDAFASGVTYGLYALECTLSVAIQLGLSVAKETLQSTETVSSSITPLFLKEWGTQQT
ncbi:carbohydrate kinase family protein [Alicyclobacillus sp. SO9]|nr:carbohydrate kinase family protein [Alicyclobacillus sp. SO9]